MDHFVSHLSARVDATAADLKTSLHSHVDSTVDSRLDTFKVELASLVRSAVVECIRTEGRYQHWRVETTYTPIEDAHQHNQSLNDVALMPNHSTSFIEGIPPPLLTEFTSATTSQCIADVTFPSNHSVSIPLYNVQPTQHQFQHISEQSSLLPNLDTTEQDNTSSQSAQTNNNQQINPEPFQTDNRVSLLPTASTSAIVSDGYLSTNSASSESTSNVLSSPVRTVQPPNDIHIKQEQLDAQSDNEDPDTNAHNVNIKTELMDCDFLVVKQEIKEEDECDGCDRWIVKKEEVSDDDEVDSDGHGLPIDEVNDEGEVVRGNDNYEVDDEPNVDNGELLSNPSRDSQNTFNANESIEEGGASFEGQEQIANTANQSNDQTQSDDLLSPSTSTTQGPNPIALTEQATISIRQKVTKRKQPTSKRSAKRSKQTIEDRDDDEEMMDIANEDREEEAKVKIVYLNCTESNCTAKLDSLDHLHDHLRTIHQLSPLQCFAANCIARFDNRGQIGEHIKLSHSQSTRFECAVCHAEYDWQHDTYTHWYKNHLTGQFECNLMDDCAQVTDNRVKMRTHRQTAHRTYSKHLHCTHPGCTATFAFQAHLKHHELTHVDGDKFHCNWPHCSFRTKKRGNLVTHIRTQHFGLPKSVKKQKEKNIVD